MSESESIAMQHARKQAHANGFQAGWHAVLARLADGTPREELRRLVPAPTAQPRPMMRFAVRQVAAERMVLEVLRHFAGKPKPSVEQLSLEATRRGHTLSPRQISNALNRLEQQERLVIVRGPSGYRQAYHLLRVDDPAPAAAR